MCKLLIGIKLNEGNNDDFNRIIQAQNEEIKSQKDGVASFVVKQNGQTITRKELNDYDKVLKPTYNEMFESRLVGIHSRIGTGGLRNEENIHFFEKDDYVFAHNGYVYEYSHFGEGQRWNSNTSWSNQSRARQTHNEYHSGNYYKPIKDYGDNKANLPTTTGISAQPTSKLTNDELDQLDDLLDELKDSRETIEACNVCESVENPCTNHFNEAMGCYMLETEIAELSQKLKTDQPKQTSLIELPTGQQAETKKERKARLKLERQAQLLAKPKELYCDSLQFLKAIPKPVTIASLIEFGNEKRFSGVAFLMDKTASRFWLMATRPIKIHTDFKSYLIAYSYEPESSFNKTQEFLGLPIIIEEQADIDTYEVAQGVYEFDLKDIKL